MQLETIIERYERYQLTGVKISLCGSSQEKENDALQLIRYIVEEILQWSPEDAMVHITPEVAHAVSIDFLMKNYISCPVDIDKTEDFGYAIYKAYPLQLRYNAEEKLLTLYREIENGQRQKFPKKFFDGEFGRYRAGFLLRYIIGAHIPLAKNDILGLYRFFANTPMINSKFREWNIYSVSRKLYSSPLEYLHTSLPENMANELYYNYFSFCHAFEKCAKQYDASYQEELKQEAEEERKAIAERECKTHTVAC